MVAGKFFRVLLQRICAGFAATVVTLAVSATAEARLTPHFQTIQPGLDYAHLQITNRPWSIHVTRLDRARKTFDLVATLGKGGAQGLGTVSAQVATVPATVGRPIAAVNADFFSVKGDPIGLSIRGGELVSAPSDLCFWMSTDRRLHIARISPALEVFWPGGNKSPMGLNEIQKSNSATLFTAGFGSSTPAKADRELTLEKMEGELWLPLVANQTYRARIREIRESGGTPITTNVAILSLAGRSTVNAARFKPGDTLQFNTTMSRDLRDTHVAVGGGPLLAKNGRAEPWPGRSASNPYVPRHPRTALGFNTHHLFLVVVDGRQQKLSVGMSLNELAEFMQQLGCTDALNLDGGGSATFWLNGRVMNSPSDGRERAVANALVIVAKP